MFTGILHESDLALTAAFLHRQGSQSNENGIGYLSHRTLLTNFPWGCVCCRSHINNSQFPRVREVGGNKLTLALPPIGLEMSSPLRPFPSLHLSALLCLFPCSSCSLQSSPHHSTVALARTQPLILVLLSSVSVFWQAGDMGAV